MYEELSAVYDELTFDAEYDKRAEYILKLFEKFGKKPDSIIDLACGTGSFSRRFAKSGIKTVGVDSSTEMLAVAESRNTGEVFYVCQKAENLNLLQKAHGAVCLLDGLNHITDYKKLSKAFKKLSLNLYPGSLFIFDLNTFYKHREILGNNTIVKETDSTFLVWQNALRKDNATVDIYLDIFKKSETGDYSRTSDIITEKAYSDADIESALKEAGFKLKKIFGEFTFRKPKETCERAVFIAEKI